jgi:leucine-zipper of insertion element IS481
MLRRPDREGEPFPAVGILIGTRLDDRSRRGVTGEFKIRELKMARPAIDPLNDGIGGAIQLVMQTSLHRKISMREMTVPKSFERTKKAVLCRRFGVSRKTGYKTLERYYGCRLEGLTDRSRRSSSMHDHN